MKVQQRQLHTESFQHISLRIPTSLHHELKKVAQKQGKSMSLFINETLEQAVKEGKRDENR